MLRKVRDRYLQTSLRKSSEVRIMTITSNIFQTGQRVPASGIYEVVGVNLAAAHNKKEKAIRLLKLGEVFPNYDGWEVCWHFAASEHQPRPEMTTTGAERL